MSTDRVEDTHCFVCRRQMIIMKRCTRCRNVLYCSQECQREDWPGHKQTCGANKDSDDNISGTSKHKIDFDRADGSIFDEETQKVDNKSSTKIHPLLVDFSKALPEAKQTSTIDPNTKKYLFKNDFYYDVPEIDNEDDSCEVTIKCNKQRHKLKVQKGWTGENLFKYLAHSLGIPLENVKLIHKGKVLTGETVMGTVQSKAVYQVIGELAENEENVDQRDISVMMKQTGLDRNKAIQKLRKKGDLLDALLDQ